jgi:hypothetical protein
MKPIFDPKVCPKCVYENGPSEGADVSGDATIVTESHRSELNRRPLLVQRGVISGKSGLFNKIVRGLSANFGRKADSTRPESVSEVCPAFRRWASSITNLFRRNRAPNRATQRPSATCNPQQSAGGAGIVRPRYPSVIAHAGTGYLAGLSPLPGPVPQELPQPFSAEFRADLARATRNELRQFVVRRGA